VKARPRGPGPGRSSGDKAGRRIDRPTPVGIITVIDAPAGKGDKVSTEPILRFVGDWFVARSLLAAVDRATEVPLCKEAR